MNNTGTLVQIIGAVVDADFSRSETLPPCSMPWKWIMRQRAAQDPGAGSPAAHRRRLGARRGHELHGRPAPRHAVRDLGHPIEVPVGPCVLGRIFNVLGESVDERGKPDCAGVRSIHRSAPPLDEQSTQYGGTGNGHQGDRLDLPLPERRQGRRVRRRPAWARPYSSWS